MMTIPVFISNVRGFFIKRNPLKKEKTYAAWADKRYNPHPKVSFVIQSHNKSAEVVYIVSKLRKYPNAEIIVIDDGSHPKHSKILVKFLSKANEFILRMNDLYENISYDRAMYFANGDFVALLQDDDDFTDLSWVDEAIEYFDKYPDMAILGGRSGHSAPSLQTIKTIVDRDWGNTGFRFVHCINRAPMWVRRTHFLQSLKHMDFNFAPVMLDDTELCLRAWSVGLSVGWYAAQFKSLSQGGMRLGNNNLVREMGQRNREKLIEIYTALIEDINRKVTAANNRI